MGLLVLAVGLALAALAADVRETWLLVPCAIALGAAYGLCLVAGLLDDRFRIRAREPSRS